MTEFAALRSKTYSYLDYDGKAKWTKKCVVKRRIKFSDYKLCLFTSHTVLRSQEVFKSESHEVYTKLHLVVIMIKDYRPGMELQYIHMEQVEEKYVKQNS